MRPRIARTITPRIATAIVYVVVTWLILMDATIVNVALPTLSRRLGVPPAHADGVIVFFLVGLSVAMPTSARLSERLGDKRSFLWASVAFVAASTLCGLAPSVGWLCGFRFLQGLAGGVLTPIGTTMYLHQYAPDERARASRLLMLPVAAAPAAGPLLGGIIVEHLSWQWVFFVNIPIGLPAAVFGWRFLEDHRTARAVHFDIRGLLLAGIGLAALMYGVSEGPADGWGSARILTPIALGVVVLIRFVAIELRSEDPLLRLRLFQEPVFARAVIASLVGFGGYGAMLFALPVVLQQGRDISPLATGLVVFPEALGIGLSTQFAARLIPHVDPRALMIGGLVACAAMVVVLASLATSHGPLILVGVAMFGAGTGIAYAMLSFQVTTFEAIPEESNAYASTLWNVAMQVGAAVSVALLSTVLALTISPRLSSYRTTLLVGAAIIMAGTIPAAAIPVGRRVVADAYN